MTNDIIIIVPKGTRVRYAENQYVDQVYVIDAQHVNLQVNFPIDPAAMLKGLPLYQPGPFPGYPDDLLERAQDARRKANEITDRDID